MRVDKTTAGQAQSAESSSVRKSAKAGAAEMAKKAQQSGAGATASTGHANVEISSMAKDSAKAKSVANEAPDVREAKVAELKRRIAEGKYKVDNQAVADRVVDDHLKMSGMS